MSDQPQAMTGPPRKISRLGWAYIRVRNWFNDGGHMKWKCWLGLHQWRVGIISTDEIVHEHCGRRNCRARRQYDAPVDNEVTRAGEGLRPFVEEVRKRRAEDERNLKEFQKKVQRDYKEWYP